ncbi:unnamed protein product [Adineta steineri]|uniref:Uncharacterized protein n=1 Tax=Adineta steineri TaxID=433720 RepID=A0A813MBP2_9BILA|nr:unnamed protein product [Adineta steineri]CAF0890230.1 unnamed protein product [Adineta steineri]
MSLKTYNNILLSLTFLIVNLYLVVETQQAISVHDISQDEVTKYVDVVEKSNGLFSLAKESFHFDFNVYRGITDVELPTIGGKISDELLKNLVSQIVLLGENGVKYANRTLDNEKGFKTAFLAFRKDRDGKYDVVYCTAKQTKEINWKKIGYTTVIAGTTALAMSVAMPGVGLVIGGLIVSGTAAITAGTATTLGCYQNYMDMQNVILGYIGKELSDRKLLVLT